ncbi:hypothetical protein BIFGAL_03752 [Bifidobacterium gallicum DSM 20093 = LMG 11596]|uniref:Alpha/beta hydrolase n=1 Tax=Bifidobacterium gallicum DSM 20093 = LMG 11596 TaxID=561180 RepID=D1NV69_9BIFI|nr:hypothetical protein BIFGAL_03752 [Bifidobacterium gallicum DSM 20093 = LMG 11596]
MGLAIVLFAVLSVLSAAMTPPWKVQPLATHLSVTDRDTAIRAKNLNTPQEGTYQVKTTKLKLTVSGGERVTAIVREPIGAPQGRPAVEFVHGAGTGKAEEVYADLANAMASAGITTLVQDKALDNYTPLHRDYTAMAHDYLTGVNHLRTVAGVDKNKVGVYAESEGTWITSVMASIDPSLAFAVLTSPPVVSPRQQIAMAATAYLHIAGAPSAVIGVVPKVTSMNFGMLDLNYANFDAKKYLPYLTMPLLVNYGTKDPAMPVEQGAEKLLFNGEKIGNRNILVRYYPTNHQMRTGSMLSKPGLPLEQHYTHNLEDWVNAVAAGTTADDWATPQIAGVQPFQEWAAPSSTKPGLITSLNVILILGALELILCACSLVSWIIGGIVNAVRIRKIRQVERQLVEGRWATDVEDAPGVSTAASNTSADAKAANKPCKKVHVPSLKRPRRVSGSTKALVMTTMLLSVMLTVGFIAYFAFAMDSALNLQDHVDQLHIWWGVLQVITILTILVFSFMVMRILLHKTTFHLPGEPAHHAKHILSTHWFIICSVILCALIMMFMAAFFGLLTF